MDNIYGMLTAERAKREAVHENSARLATVSAQGSSNGWGEYQFPDCITFDVTFVEQPTFSYGYAIDGDLLVDTRFPRSHGFVYRWRTNVKGFWTGAWVAVVVDTSHPLITTSAAEPNYDLDHSFVFSGIAMKDASAYLAEG